MLEIGELTHCLQQFKLKTRHVYCLHINAQGPKDQLNCDICVFLVDHVTQQRIVVTCWMEQHHPPPWIRCVMCDTHDSYLQVGKEKGKLRMLKESVLLTMEINLACLSCYQVIY